jgi:hypothetical protein
VARTLNGVATTRAGDGTLRRSLISGAVFVLAVLFGTVACSGGQRLPAPTATASPAAVCPPPAIRIAKVALGFTACFPAGWGADPRDPQSLDQESGFIIYQAPSDTTAGLRVRVDFASPGATFQGCTPHEPSPVASLPAFCEDIYNILPSGEATFSSSGKLTAWKFLAPVGPRVINGQAWDSGRIYIKAVFPSARRDALTPTLSAVLSSVEIAR